MMIQVDRVFKFLQAGPLLVRALRGVSLNIAEGSFTALCGPSGSGKTTLLNLIGCMDRPTDGKIFFDKNEISSMSQRDLTRFRLNKIGFIFQDYNLIPTFTVAENIEYVLWLRRVSASERRRKALDIARRVQIDHLLARRPDKLSRGQQQRVAVARALVHGPRIVLGDELTANLDHQTGAKLMDFLKELNEQQGITFLYATHDPLIFKRARQIITLSDGQIIEDKDSVHN
jgi:putative ABC transport system ATP-binding protein